MDKGNNKNIIVKLICLILSFGLWLYVSNVENPTRTSDVKNIEVELLNEDAIEKAGLAITPNQIYTVNLKLEGLANIIYTVKKSDFVVRADLSNYALKPGENNVPVEVVSYPQGITIKNSGVLAIKINLEEFTEKEVKVTSNVMTSYKNGYSEDNLSIYPSTVTVSGPKSLVNSVVKVELQGELLNISNDITQSFRLVAVDSDGYLVQGVKLSKSTGELSVGVGSRKEVDIDVSYIGTLDSGLQLDNVELSKRKIKVVGSLDKLNNLQNISTEPIDLSKVKASQSVNVKLIFPSGVYAAEGEHYITANLQITNLAENNNNSGDTSSETNNNSELSNKKIDEIKVNIENENLENLKYKVEDISIELVGLEWELNNVTSSNIIATISASDINEAGEYEVNLNVQLENVGQSVKIKSKPEKVKVTVT